MMRGAGRQSGPAVCAHHLAELELVELDRHARRRQKIGPTPIDIDFCAHTRHFQAPAKVLLNRRQRDQPVLRGPCDLALHGLHYHAARRLLGARQSPCVAVSHAASAAAQRNPSCSRSLCKSIRGRAGLADVPCGKQARQGVSENSLPAA